VSKELDLLIRKGQSLSSDIFPEVSKVSDKLYYDREAQVNWQELVDANLSTILSSSLTTEAKAAATYGSAARTTQQIFQDFNEESYESAQETVSTMNKLMDEPGDDA